MKATLYGLTKNKNDIHVKSQLEKMLAQVSADGAAVIDGVNIAAESIYGKSIVAGSIEAAQIKAGAITSDHITTNGIVADKIKTGVLRSTNGASWLNLNDGTFSYANGNFTFQNGKMVVRAHTIELGGKEVPTKTETEEYADGKITAEKERAIADAQAKLDEAKKYVDDLEFGGRNLAHSENIRYSYGTLSSKSTKNIIGNGLWFIDIQPGFLPNTTYTISNKKIINAGSNGENLNVLIYNNGISTLVQTIGRFSSGNKTTFTTSSNVQDTDRMLIYLSNGNVSGNFEIQEFKLEKGNKATDWTEAPEDVELEQNKKVYNPVRYIRDWLNGSSANASNHWCEIMVNDTNGTNVAKGKTVTTNGTASSLGNVTDGLVNNAHAGTGIGKHYVEIDLGSVYHNIASVSTWHYYSDNRTYYETQTEVSEDRINWYPVFDSLTEGTYAETESGKTCPNTRARAESLISAYNMSQQLATSTSKVVINGGNITAGTVKSANSDSWINLDNGQFSFGKGNMVWNGSNLTVKGNIDAASINTGTLSTSRIPDLSADKITVGTLKDKSNKNNINLDTGTFSLANGNIVYNGSTLSITGGVSFSALDSTTQANITNGAAAKTKLDSKESVWDAKLTDAQVAAKILSDKAIKDTRKNNQNPAWYFSNYPNQIVREFKEVSTMGVGTGTYGILTTDVPWSGNSGGSVKQAFRTNTEEFKRDGTTTSWTAWVNHDAMAVGAKTLTDKWAFTGKTTINGGQIEADTITATQIDVANLSALSANLGNVTAGTIKSTNGLIDINLNTGVINLGQPLTINFKPIATKEDVDSLEIGGRNLISSLQENWEAGWWDTKTGTLNGSSAHFRTVDGYKVIVEPNKTYTISGRGRIVVLEYRANGNYISSIDLGANSLPNTFTTNANTGFLRFYILTPQTTLPPKSDIVSFEFKLEKGNKATDWTEAAEDVEAAQNKKVYNPVRYVRDWANGSGVNTSNHWFEIMAYSKGQNVALGKPVTTSGTASALSVITDGDIAGTYGGSGAGKHYVQVDLGKVYYDIDSVRVWRYYTDNRTYKETKTEVSHDGINWSPIFDSYIEGEIPETSSGSMYSNTTAKTESLLQSILTKTQTSAYADGVIDAEEKRAIKDAQEKLKEAKKYVDDLEIGGRNLLAGTSEEEQEVKTSSWSLGSWNPSLIIGEDYTFSFDIKSENATSLQNVFLNNSNNGFAPNVPVTKEWTRIHFTFKWKGGSYSGNEFVPHVYPRPNYVGTYTSRVKLEKGNKATDWTPAPEDVQEQLVAIETRVSNAELSITPESITATVVESEDLTSKLKGYATQESLGSYISSDDFTTEKDNIIGEIDSRIGAIDYSPFVQTSELEQKTNAITAKFSQAGGVNLIQNSIGWAGKDFWSNFSATAGVSIQNDELSSMGFGSGWYSQESGQYTQKQRLTLPRAGTYTLSFWLKKTVGSSWAYVQIQKGADTTFSNANAFAYAGYSGARLTDGYELFTTTFEATELDIAVSITINTGVEATITGIMLHEGSEPFKWQPYTSEVYNTNVKMDINGITVKNNQDAGYTLITPDEFSGYAPVDGTVEKVFTLNGDTTEVKKLKAEQQFQMAPVTIITIDNSKYSGWAFI